MKAFESKINKYLYEINDIEEPISSNSKDTSPDKNKVEG